MSDKSVKLPADYTGLLADIKQRVRHAQTRAVLAVNGELIRLYWEIGALIDTRQKKEGWGAGVIPRLARDLHNELPEEKGFSERNIKQMLAFCREYPHLEFVQQPVAQIEFEPKVQQLVALFPVDLIQSIPWGHHGVLIAKVKNLATRQWYMQAAMENGWSRNILVMQIETAAHVRLGRATSNFARRLPPPDSDLVQQTLKDPYLFDFLTQDWNDYSADKVVFQPKQMSPDKLQELLDYAWNTFYHDESQKIKMVKLFQQVVKKEMADDTFKPRARSLAGQSFGRDATR